jgi:hypothetical protein
MLIYRLPNIFPVNIRINLNFDATKVIQSATLKIQMTKITSQITGWELTEMVSLPHDRYSKTCFRNSHFYQHCLFQRFHIPQQHWRKRPNDDLAF